MTTQEQARPLCKCGHAKTNHGTSSGVCYACYCLAYYPAPAPLVRGPGASEGEPLTFTDAELEIARSAIEDVLIEWRDNRMSTLRANGLVIHEADGRESSIIRMGPETAVQIGVEAIRKHRTHVPAPAPVGAHECSPLACDCEKSEAPVGAEGTEKGGQDPITAAVGEAVSGEANEWPHPNHPGCWVVRMKCPICNAHLIRNVHLNESHHPCHDPNCGRRP